MYFFLSLAEKSSFSKNDKVFPIFLGTLEMSLILASIYKQQQERPHTHDLLYNLLQKVGYKVMKVYIHKYEGKILYANIYCTKKQGKTEVNKIIKIDSRPSDAIILAFTFPRLIFYINKSIFEKLSLPLDKFHLEKDNSFVDIFSSNQEIANNTIYPF